MFSRFICYQMTRFLTPFYLFAAIASLFSALTLFLIVPMSRFKLLVPAVGEALAGKELKMTLASLIASGVFYGLYLLYKNAPKKESGSLPLNSQQQPPSPFFMGKKSRYLLIGVQIVLSSLIIFRVSMDLNTNLDFDELRISNNILSGSLVEMSNPTKKIAAHPLQTILAYFSATQLGASPATLRLPSVLVTGIFLILLNLFLWRLNSPLIIVGVLLHLTANECFIWYGHSMRGYISMLLFSFIPLWVLIDYVRSQQLSLKALLLYILFTSTVIFTQPFGTAFVGVYFLSLALWLGCNHKDLEPKVYSQAMALLNASILAVLVQLPIAIAMLLNLLQKDWILNNNARGALHFGPKFLMQFFGGTYIWVMKLHAVFAFIVIGIRFSQRDKIFKDFLNCFALIMVLFYISCVVFLETHLNARYLYPIIVAYTLWVAQSLTQIERPSARVVMASGYFFLMVFLPLKQGPTILKSREAPTAVYNSFIRGVVELTGPREENCYSFSGIPEKHSLTKKIFLRDIKDFTTTSTQCQNHYHLYFQGESSDGVLFEEPSFPNSAKYLPLLTDEAGNTLFFEKTNPRG